MPLDPSPVRRRLREDDQSAIDAGFQPNRSPTIAGASLTFTWRGALHSGLSGTRLTAAVVDAPTDAWHSLIAK
jgi:hypothetical protein